MARPSHTVLADSAFSEFVERHGGQIMAAARRFSASPADAEDAYQRALEVLLTKAPIDDPSKLLPWILVVARNESLMLRRGRNNFVDKPVEEFNGLSDAEPAPDQHAIDSEMVGYTREALRRLKPDHARCLMLLAAGMSYAEIGELTGLSPTKVHRYIADARKKVRILVGSLDAGKECRRVVPLLSMIADGEADEEVKSDAQVHLDNCNACRATLREFRAMPRRVEALVPIAIFTPVADPGGAFRRLGDHFNALVGALQDRVASHGSSLHPATELALAKKAVAVTALTATTLAGGYTAERIVRDDAKPTQRTEQTVSRDTPANPRPIRADSRDVEGRAHEEVRPREARESDLLEADAGAPDHEPIDQATPKVDEARLFSNPTDKQAPPVEAPVEQVSLPPDDPVGGP